VIVNGTAVFPDEPSNRLLDYLRNDLDLTGAKEGCGMGECGACTVLLDGEPVCSCLVLVGQVGSREVTTAEGLAADGLAPVQQAFVDHHASQCGFCTPGMVMALTAILRAQTTPSVEEIRTALVGNLCRCTGFGSILEAARSGDAQ
jgi:carbon-monoxide dehydrogenase small subunit